MKRIGLALAALMIATGASAADYPTKPIPPSARASVVPCFQFSLLVPFEGRGLLVLVASASG